MLEINEIKKLVGEDNLDKAILYFEQVFEENPSYKDFKNEFILLKGKYNDWKKENRLAISDKETLYVNIQKIRLHLLQIVDEIGEIKSDRANKNTFFHDLIEPMNNKLMLIHDEWLSSLLKYREMVENRESIAMEEFIALLQKDSLYSTKQRLEINIQHTFGSNIPELSEYVEAVGNYMGISNALNPDYIANGENPELEEQRREYLNANIIRMDLIESIKILEEKELAKSINASNKQKIINRIDELVIFLHSKFEIVQTVFYQLKFES
jgi:hypothetical protein